MTAAFLEAVRRLHVVPHDAIRGHLSPLPSSGMRLGVLSWPSKLH